ncbi:hypothetical protein F5Y18DRAFT_415172 [Xylariaceae sp. FL1019]|nr:hypothetical protein F5Y18DRAFT_415172 [Xylariaceae sp. FL1019]
MDPQEPSSELGLLVIHAALFKMSIKSLAKAYRMLGYKVHHAIDDVRGVPWVQIEQAAEVVIVQRDFDPCSENFDSELLDALSRPFVYLIGVISWYTSGIRAVYAMKKVHYKYYDTLRKTVPPERRLEYKLGDGWEPLCAYLGKDIPNVPFQDRIQRNRMRKRC